MIVVVLAIMSKVAVLSGLESRDPVFKVTVVVDEIEPSGRTVSPQVLPGLVTI